MAERDGFENHCRGNPTGGSNPPLSATSPPCLPLLPWLAGSYKKDHPSWPARENPVGRVVDVVDYSGEVTEWLKELAWKASAGVKACRGFESPPLRQSGSPAVVEGIDQWVPGKGAM